jgi:hypothetical protein
MGALRVPASGIVYVDTMTVIYTVERYPVYFPLLEPMWQAGQAGTIEIVSSELTLMETLVRPSRAGTPNWSARLSRHFWGRKCGFFPSRNRSCEKPHNCGQPPS